MEKSDLLKRARQFYDEYQVLELEHAIDFASSAHADQKRLSGEPYINHPIYVANKLISWGMDIDSVLAGVLHDIVEDTTVSLDKIESLFGGDVAFIVDGVTKVSKASADMEDLTNYTPKTKDNLSKLLIAVGQDIRVLIIKLADRLHNLSTLQYMPPEKQQKIARESLEVFGPMADRLGMGRVRLQIEEMAFSYLNPAEFKRLKTLVENRLGKNSRQLEEVKKEVVKALDEYGIKAEIDGRVKSIYSLYVKLAKVNGNIDDIYDLIALRIIVDRKEDCYLVLGILHSLYQPIMISRIKDYISTPKPNGYQSLHTTVITHNEQIVEFQIRTYEMHEFAERGLAASFHYNEQKKSKDYKLSRNSATLPSNMQWITQLQEVVAKLKNGEEISRDQLQIDLFGNRIFVHSPKGDIYNLPEGALPLDFAYLVHSDIGKHAYSFRVNGKIHPFDKPLQNGDIVEVVTRKLSLPKPAWKNLITTTHARNKLRAQLGHLGLTTMITDANKVIREKTAQNINSIKKIKIRPRYKK